MRPLAAVLLVILLAGCGPNPPSAPVSGQALKFGSLAGDAAKGRAAFIGTCAACHGQAATGMPGLGKDLTKSDFAKNLSNADLALFLSQGRPGGDPANTTKVDMPPRGGNPGLTDQDLMNIVAFIRTVQE
jgi:mono/diheme cytochrome c family protein